MTVDEAKLDVDGREVYVRAAADCETLEALDMEVSPSRSNFDALVFLGDGLARGVVRWCGPIAARGTTGRWTDSAAKYERGTWMALPFRTVTR